MFLHLRAHSCYSFLEGLPAPAALAKAAADQGMPVLGLTDHDSLAGAIEFYTACREAGVRPLLGLELWVDPPEDRELELAARPASPLALLAMDLAGWGSLCRLSSLLMGTGSEAGRSLIPFNRLAEETQGLICLSGGRRGLAAQQVAARQEKAAVAWLQQLNELFPGRLYVELQQHVPEDRPLAIRLATLAHRLKLPVVATHSIHYLDSAQAGLQRLATSIRLIRPLAQVTPEQAAPPGAFFKSAAEMAAAFSDLPAALDNTAEIADRCSLELPLGAAKFPQLDLPADQTVLQALRQKAEAGARRRYPAWSEQIQARLDQELEVIGGSGYAPLFLIMEEIVSFARRSGIPLSSRGSAASSLVAHCLGITSPDPLRHNLYFERFLNPARATLPDIDTDLCSRRRDEVLRFVVERFGAERAAQVGTVNRFRRRSALRETAKAHGLQPGEIRALADRLPHRWRPHHPAGDKAPYAELSGLYPDPLHQAIFKDAEALIGLPHHLSVHAGGVVIAPGRMTDLVPTQLAAKGVTVTQFDLDSIEALGLIKIDLLGIRGLTVLGDVAQGIAERHAEAALIHPLAPELSPAQGSPNFETPNRRMPFSQDRAKEGEPANRDSPLPKMGERPGVRALNPTDILESIPEEDPDTAELVRSARTIGCFQIESPGMRATLQEIQAHSVEDILVALALYRPGPLTGGLKDAFVRRHRGQEPVSQLHPALSPLLADTYGVILYQEQVLRIAHELAGLSLADSDLLRRAMSHFDPGKQMITLQEKFIAGADQRSGVPAAVANRVWELMAAFAGYGFPKAHAASYAQVAWRSAWCKVHFPAEFLAAVLANWGGYYSQRVYLMEARRLGLPVRPPQVNYARREFSAVYLENQPVLFMGLDQVRELTRRTQARILQQRPFHSLADFLARVDPRPVEAENLVRAGALEDFGPIPALLRELKGGWQRGQMALFALESAEDGDWSLAEKVAAQEAMLGASLAAHPLELHKAALAQAGTISSLAAAGQVGRQVRVAGLRQGWRKLSGVYSLSLEDADGMLEVLFFPEAYRRCRAALSGPGPYVIEGVVELDETSGEPLVIAHNAWLLPKE